MVSQITFIERDLSEDELEQVRRGFIQNEILNTRVHQTSDRYGFVALDGENLIGCSSGLAYINGDEYNGWFYLTDLFIEKTYRGQGHGKRVLQKLEDKLIALGIDKIYLWTAGFEAPEFYKKHGYEVFVELENYFKTGHSRLGMKKLLKS